MIFISTISLAILLKHKSKFYLMKILFVFSGNSAEKISPYIEEQINSLLETGIEVDKFAIIGKGFTGYLSNLKKGILILMNHIIWV